jgi:hypothetical protein
MLSRRRSRLGRVRMYWVNITTRDDSLIEDELQSFMISRWCNRPDDVRVRWVSPCERFPFSCSLLVEQQVELFADALDATSVEI